MDIKRGDIVLVKLEPSENIQGGIRPALIVQNNVGNKFSPTTIIIPLTSQLKKTNQPTHEIITKHDTNGLKFDSMALCEQIRTISKTKIEKKIGQIINESVMTNVMRACSVSLGM